MMKLNTLGTRFFTLLLISALFVAAPAWSNPDIKSSIDKPAGNTVKDTGKDKGRDNDANKPGKKDGNMNAGSSVKKKAAKKAGTAAVSVETVLEIGWDDLKIQEPFNDPFATLTPDQLSYLSMVYRYRAMRTELGYLPDTSQASLDEALAELMQAGVNVDEMLAQRERVAKIRQQRAVATNTVLNNKDIQIPGYLLPLEYADNKKVTEFLLVPFFGACIHTPPPPPNQIIHVKFEQGFKSTGLFQPVMVEGKLQSQQGTASLSYKDGVSEIPVSYVISAQEVKLYQQAPK